MKTISSAASFQGLLTDFKFSDLAQFIANSRQSGRLAITSPNLTGEILFQEGVPVSASVKGKQNLQGDEAFLSMVGLEEGSFRFEVGLNSQAEKNIHRPLTQLLLEGIKKYDEWLTFRDTSELELDLVPRLILKLPAGQEIIQFSSAQWSVVALINGRRTFLRIAEKLQTSPEALQPVFRELIALGILERKMNININRVIPVRSQPKSLDYHHTLPSSLKANLLLRFIDGQTPLGLLAEKLNLSVRDVTSELKQLYDSHWVQFASGEKEFLHLVEEI